MTLTKRFQQTGDQRGFTLVELLVVMLILGLLVAIALPSFLSQSLKAKDANAKTDARSAESAIEAYSTDHNGSYAGATVADLEAIETTLTDATLAISGLSPRAYTVTATSSTGTAFSISRAASGTTSVDCGPPAARGQGGCPADGNWAR